jgi:hypothetical protein
MRQRLRFLGWRRKATRSDVMESDTQQEPATIVIERDSEPGEYLIDGFRLYRVIVSRVFHEEKLVELEECRTLDVCLVPAEELGSLRPVRPADARLPARQGSARSWSPPRTRPGW